MTASPSRRDLTASFRVNDPLRCRVLSWRLESGRSKPLVDAQRIVEVTGLVNEGIAFFTGGKRGCGFF
jgi:hypothetical protein